MNAFFWIGVAVTAIVVGGAVAIAVMCALFVIEKYWPRFNYGRPENILELKVFDSRRIIRTIDGKRITEPPRLIRSLTLTWWCGLSCRSRPKWWIGLIRWNQAPGVEQGVDGRDKPGHDGSGVRVMTAPAPTRPVLRWHGGKWRLAPAIIAHFPPHRIYVEPFGGAASVLVRKARTYAEIYNDLDDEVVALFRVLRDRGQGEQLRELLRLTPFARSEFRGAYEPTDDPLERSRRLIIRSFMGFGSNAHASEHKGHRSTGFRSNSSRSGTTPAQDWKNYPQALDALIARLDGVVIECRDAREVMAQHDAPATLHYVDPPYLPETRARGNRYNLAWRMYRHELSRDDHAELLTFLAELDGMVVLSGYPDPLYDQVLGRAWRRVEIDTYADGARPRVEVLWINPAAVEALGRSERQPRFSFAVPA